MATIGWVLLAAGIVISLIGGIWILVKAFEEHIGWGLACLLIPFASLVFVIMHWDRTAKPFLISLGGGALALVGSFLGAGGTN